MEPVALIVLLIVLAGQLPFAFRRGRSWWPWLAGLTLALASVAVLLGLIYLGSAIAGTSGDMGRVQSAWRFALVEAGGGLLIAAALAPFVASGVLYAIEHVWSRLTRGSAALALLAIYVLLASVTLPLAVMGARDLQKSWPAGKASQQLKAR